MGLIIIWKGKTGGIWGKSEIEENLNCAGMNIFNGASPFLIREGHWIKGLYKRVIWMAVEGGRGQGGETIQD